MTRRIAVATAVVAVLAAAQMAQAADITWGAPQDITGNLSDFDTSGNFLYGYSGDSLDRMVTGVGLFASAGLLPNGVYNADSNGNFATVYPGADAEYDDLIQNATWGNNPTAPAPISLGGLTAGNLYSLQLWASDARNCCSGGIASGWEKTYGDGNGNNVTITAGNLNGGNPTALPQYVIGTFMADGPSQTLEFPDIGAGNSHPQYNALMVRDAIPEPSSVALALTGLLSLAGCMRRRRRRA